MADTKTAAKAPTKAQAAAAAKAAFVGNMVAYTDRSGHTYPALVTIDAKTFDTAKASTYSYNGSRPVLDAEGNGYGPTTVSVVVFRPAGTTYARHNVPFAPKPAEGERSWRPLA